MKNETNYKRLETDLLPIKKILLQAAEVIQDEDVSKFPIFILHRDSVDIGINIVTRESAGGQWSVNASTLEEFSVRQLIQQEKLDDFKTLYKTHPGDLCLFVVEGAEADFIFYPK